MRFFRNFGKTDRETLWRKGSCFYLTTTTNSTRSSITDFIHSRSVDSSSTFGFLLIYRSVDSFLKKVQFLRILKSSAIWNVLVSRFALWRICLGWYWRYSSRDFNSTTTKRHRHWNEVLECLSTWFGSIGVLRDGILTTRRDLKNLRHIRIFDF